MCLMFFDDFCVVLEATGSIFEAQAVGSEDLTQSFFILLSKETTTLWPHLGRSRSLGALEPDMSGQASASHAQLLKCMFHV